MHGMCAKRGGVRPRLGTKGISQSDCDQEGDENGERVRSLHNCDDF
jgi:hypothetical protein